MTEAAGAWAALAGGCYLPAEYCPAELADELIDAVSAALELEPGVPLGRAHSLRMRFARQAATGSASGAGTRSLRETIARIEIAAGPNFKGVLRARVLASGEPYQRLLAAYGRIAREHVLPRLAALLGEAEFALQREPSLRFSLPNASALGARPGDSDARIGLHADSEYDHQLGEMNIMLALSPVFGANGLFVESAAGAGDFAPVALEPGRLFAFHGVSCRHHNQRNTTDAARVSLDFRFIPLSRYERARDSEPPGSRRARFTLGEYFERVVVAAPIPPTEPLPPSPPRAAPPDDEASCAPVGSVAPPGLGAAAAAHPSEAPEEPVRSNC